MNSSQSVSQFERLKKKIAENRAKMAIIGLGYVGLPLAIVFAEAGFDVTGLEINPEKEASVNRGESYIPDVPSEAVARLVGAGKLRASGDFARLHEIDLVTICVPTPLRNTGDPDLSFIIDAADQIAPYLHPGMAITFESSTYPGTTRELILPRISGGSDWVVGEDFFLIFSPERIDPGRSDYSTKTTPKVIGGMTARCTEIAKLWYGRAIDWIVPVSSPEVAEMAKLHENTFRMVNIAYVNELAQICDRLELDVWEVIDAAATKPFGFMRFTPGPGLGGHCIPVDPHYLSWKMKSMHYNTRFIELASEINTNMPRYTVGLIQDALNRDRKSLNGAKILVMGVAYKANIDDMRESPALDVIHLLIGKGAEVEYYDPYVPSFRLDNRTHFSLDDPSAAMADADCVVILTDHRVFDRARILRDAKLIVDTRNFLGEDGKGNSKVVRL